RGLSESFMIVVGRRRRPPGLHLSYSGDVEDMEKNTKPKRRNCVSIAAPRVHARVLNSTLAADCNHPAPSRRLSEQMQLADFRVFCVFRGSVAELFAVCYTSARSREHVARPGHSPAGNIDGDFDSKSIPGLPGVSAETLRRERRPSQPNVGCC